jgi:hypothetical protein
VKIIAAIALLTLMLSALAGPSTAMTGSTRTLDYPDGYRHWTHVKSSMIGPSSKLFDSSGGFQHIYANEQAMVGYRSGSFPDGAVIVFEWLELREADGVYQEGPRRRLDVMVKDSQGYSTSGDWGFQRFVKDSRTEIAASPTPAQCLACHRARSVDGLVLSRYRD